ncbi:hypothetical protein EV175_006177, partial [Coemansia sp. RSA 1933]
MPPVGYIPLASVRQASATGVKTRCPCSKALRSLGYSDSKDKPVVRFFNRDLAVVLNFRHIVLSLRNTGDIPERFKRETPMLELRQLPPMPVREYTK